MKLPQVFILLVCIALSGCVVTNDRPIDVTVGELQILRVSPFDQRFKLTLDISNKSSRPLFVRRLDYKIALGGVDISEGEEDIWREIPAFSTQQIDLFFSTNIWGQLSPIFAAAKDSGQLDYYLTGELTTGMLLYQQVSYIRYADALTQDQLPMRKLQKLQKLIPKLGF